MKHITSFDNFLNESTVPKYIAQDTINGKKVQLTVLKTDLISSKLGQLVTKLNKAGWRLGSGHDGMEIEADDKYFKYFVTLIPYIGAPTQKIEFSLLN